MEAQVNITSNYYNYHLTEFFFSEDQFVAKIPAINRTVSSGVPTAPVSSVRPPTGNPGGFQRRESEDSLDDNVGPSLTLRELKVQLICHRQIKQFL